MNGFYGHALNCPCDGCHNARLQQQACGQSNPDQLWPTSWWGSPPQFAPQPFEDKLLAELRSIRHELQRIADKESK